MDMEGTSRLKIFTGTAHPALAKEISDYIPSGLKFNKADNPDWTEKNGKIVTTKLKDTLLKPGQTAEV